SGGGRRLLERVYCADAAVGLPVVQVFCQDFITAIGFGCRQKKRVKELDAVALFYFQSPTCPIEALGENIYVHEILDTGTDIILCHRQFFSATFANSLSTCAEMQKFGLSIADEIISRAMRHFS
ncbi:MAG: hypothetical protein IKO40_13865, partial [Kiritimatiellae bacterium]|nr:hypothetical protein [Kiritimatiellia bacterium]